ncbi:hypothetical protein MPER_03489, partial [Moniliophthora perniciosa FA553]
RANTQFSDVSFRDYENGKAIIAASHLDLQEVSISHTSADTEEELAANAAHRRPSRTLEHELRTRASSNSVRSGSGRMSNGTSTATRFAGRIIFNISASNWRAVFSRLSSKISLLDRQRLTQVLNELSSLLVNMSSEAHKAIVVPLRSAIWSWIEYFPVEFNETIRSRGKMEGAS